MSTPAQAVWVRPSQAPLLNAAGADSTCVLTTKGSTFVRDGIRRLKHKGEVLCQTTWIRHKLEVSAFVVQDGQRVPIYSGGGSLTSGWPSTTSGVTTVGPICHQDAWGLPWDPQPGATYQIILATKATVKATTNNTGEAWTARTEKLVEVTC
jgi:hypothetical protein